LIVSDPLNRIGEEAAVEDLSKKAVTERRNHGRRTVGELKEWRKRPELPSP